MVDLSIGYSCLLDKCHKLVDDERRQGAETQVEIAQGNKPPKAMSDDIPCAHVRNLRRPRSFPAISHQMQIFRPYFPEHILSDWTKI